MVAILTELFKEAKKRNFFWALLNQLILSIGAAVIIVGLSNILTVEMFGQTRFLVAVLAIFSFFSLPGVGPVMLQKISSYSRTSVLHAIIMQLKWGIGAMIGAFIFAGAYFVRGEIDLSGAFLVSGILAPIANLYLMPGTIYAGLKKFKEKTFCDGFIVTSTIIGAAVGAFYFDSLTATMLWYFLAQTLATGFCLYQVIRQLSGVTSTELNLLADSLYGKQLSVFQILLVLMPALEKALVFFLLGPVALAFYVIALLPIEHLHGAYRSLLQFFSLPHLQSREDHVYLFQYLKKMSIVFAASSIAITLIFAVFFLPILFSDYIDSQQFVFLSMTILIVLPAEMFILSLLSDRRIDYLFVYAFISILTNILIFVFFMSLFGLQGAIVAKILATFVRAGVAYSLYRRNGRIFELKKIH